MEYIAGALAGIVFGCAVACIKHYALWSRYLKNTETKAPDSSEAISVYTKAMISFGVNIAAFALVFFIRDVLPFDAIATMVGTAVALASMNGLLASRQHKKAIRGQEGGKV